MTVDSGLFELPKVARVTQHSNFRRCTYQQHCIREKLKVIVIKSGSRRISFFKYNKNSTHELNIIIFIKHYILVKTIIFRDMIPNFEFGYLNKIQFSI